MLGRDAQLLAVPFVRGLHLAVEDVRAGLLALADLEARQTDRVDLVRVVVRALGHGMTAR